MQGDLSLSGSGLGAQIGGLRISGNRTMSTHAKEAAPSASPIPANYRYWQEHGGDWAREYDRRKKQGPKYHIAEVLICDYMLHHAPARVLEYGCGVGRHLRYLSQIPDLDAHGYDQSPTMARGCLDWADPDWYASHVTVGPPTGRTAYEDGAFDIVYTASVLVHVRPEDLGGVLTEVLRLSRGHVLHFESRYRAGAEAYTDDHSGCWLHDVIGAYRDLGFECQDVTAGLCAQAVYRVAHRASPRWTWSPVMLGLLERMRSDLTPDAAGSSVPVS